MTALTGQIASSSHLQKLSRTAQLTDVPRGHVHLYVIAVVRHQPESLRTAWKLGQTDPCDITGRRRDGILISATASQGPEEVGLDEERELVESKLRAIDGDGDVGQLARVEELGEVHDISHVTRRTAVT